MSLSTYNKPSSILAFVARRVRQDLQFSRIFLVDFAASASYAATTLILLGLAGPTEGGAGALIAAGLGWILFFVLKILLVVYLEKSGGDAREFVGSETLVTSGVYAFSRNPVYVMSLFQSLCWSLGLVGLGLSGHPYRCLALLAAPTLLYGHWWGMDRLIVPHEEAALRAKHSEAFAAYCARVNRWFGRRG
ncbi:methyltransferase family protein [Methylocystis sp. JAN1]|uniref:methyltransferase family protein n=1 Tax=Methylocystis sp. JAN1 TaxID=3397211 RepID=UPI003FA31C8D